MSINDWGKSWPFLKKVMRIYGRKECHCFFGYTLRDVNKISSLSGGKHLFKQGLFTSIMGSGGSKHSLFAVEGRKKHKINYIGETDNLGDYLSFHDLKPSYIVDVIKDRFTNIHLVVYHGMDECFV